MRHVCPRMLFFPDRAGWGYGSVWAEGSAWQASGLRALSLRKGSFPSGGGWLVLPSEEDALSLRQQGRGVPEPVQAAADGAVPGGSGLPSGANRFRKGSHGRENEWRRLQIGFEAVFFKNRLTLHSLTNMGSWTACTRWRMAAGEERRRTGASLNST